MGSSGMDTQASGISTHAIQGNDFCCEVVPVIVIVGFICHDVREKAVEITRAVQDGLVRLAN